MKYCSKCGSEILDETVICPHCGCQVAQPQMTQNGTQYVSEENKAIPILALVFGILGGWLGLVFGIIGLVKCKDKTNKILSAVGLGLSALWVIFQLTIIITTGSAVAEPY